MTAERSGSARSELSEAELDQAGFESDDLSMRETAARAIIRLHGCSDDQHAQEREDSLPGQPGQCKGTDPKVLCLRPNEWLIISEKSSDGDLLRENAEAWANEAFFAFEESAGLARLSIQGKAAPWLLAKHCSLDMTKLNEGDEGCAQTRLGRISVLMHYRVNGLANQFTLIVDRSLVLYLWELLASGIPHALELAESIGAKDPLRP